jgi:serine protein kinase
MAMAETPTVPTGTSVGSSVVRELLVELGTSVRDDFTRNRRVMSFAEYLNLVVAEPLRQLRSSTQYIVDCLDHYGTSMVKYPWGEVRRFHLFDAPWAGGEDRLFGQENVQNAVYRVLRSFVQDGRPNKLILLHGPNGSAKSTFIRCLGRALEHYSTLDEGALYRFHWVFPSRKKLKGAIGFGGEGAVSASEGASYAHLDDDQIDARLVIELRDHPLFLLPIPERKSLLLRLYAAAGVKDAPPDWLLSGKLSHKNQQVFEALFTSYKGSLAEVLRHVQVERWFISRRYRTGAVTLGPALSVDAGERQITADRSLSALPTSLQATTLFEAHGELIEAAGGVLEFSDLLKRPLDAFRYLQLTLETGEVALQQQTVQTNVVMIGSANEIHHPGSVFPAPAQGMEA